MEFIVRSVGYIDITNVSAQVSVFIHTRFKDAVDNSGNQIILEGANPEDVENHIRKHVLHPKIRICVLIKELLEFQDHLRKNLVVEDNLTGLTAVDKGSRMLLFFVAVLSGERAKAHLQCQGTWSST